MTTFSPLPKGIGTAYKVVAVLAVFLLFAGFYWYSATFVPFMMAFFLAFVLNAPVEWLESKGLRRAWSAPLILFSFWGGSIGLVAYGLPILINHTATLIGQVPGFIDTTLAPLLERYLGMNVTTAALLAMVPDYLQSSLALFRHLLQHLGTAATFTLDQIFLFLIVPLLTFYFLLEWPHLTEKLKKLIRDFVPDAYDDHVDDLADKIGLSLRRLVQGQMLVCTLISVYYGVGLTLAGLPMGWAIGIAMGFLSMLPYVGFLFGAALAFTVALIHFQFVSWVPYAVIGGVLLSGNAIEGNILTPRIVSRKLELHDAWILFALMLGGQMAGIFGMFMALPAMAVVKVLAMEGHKAWVHAWRPEADSAAPVPTTSTPAAPPAPPIPPDTP